MGILDWIRGKHGGDAVTDEALERIVRLTNPRLRYARRYRARLAPALQRAMDHACALVASVPPARDASPAAWQSDPCMRAFFATANDLAGALSRSPELRAWFDTHPSASEVYTVLSMLLVERKTLGTAVEGGVLRREVPQTTVSFTDYRARLLGPTEPELRKEIERRIVDQLALTGLALATQDQSRRDVLEQERALLRARLRLLQGKGAGLTALGGKPAPEAAQIARVQADLAVNEGNLQALAAGMQGLDYQLDRLCEVLGDPGTHFFVTPRRIRIDRMNVVLPDDSTQPGETLDLHIVRIPIPDGEPETRTVSFVRFPRALLLPREALLSDAAKSLH